MNMDGMDMGTSSSMDMGTMVAMTMASMTGMDMGPMTDTAAAITTAMAGMTDMGMGTMTSMSGMPASTSMGMMDMGGSSNGSSTAAAMVMSCKMSMLWNWYTIDTCIISSTWKNSTRGRFAGTCIGVFLMVVATQWLRRLHLEWNNKLIERRAIEKRNYLKALGIEDSDLNIKDILSDEEKEKIVNEGYFATVFIPILEALKHKWLLKWTDKNTTSVYRNFLDHVIEAGLFTIQWTLTHLIMLLYMYFNGYIIISTFLGALFGRILFGYEPLCTCKCSSANDDGNFCEGVEDVKNCCS
ncbi:unnamed protein product [[Candida] boidinii]|nr:hypothetical protein B5S33_g1707 [[Candida] boidinii]GMF39610.1 unnamed protein product [[Candida] boidinii]